MCGRYHHHLSKMHGWSDALRDWPADLPDADVFPRSQIAASRGGACEAMRWGLVNRKAREFFTKAATHNARIETVAELWTFRDAWNAKQRCLIPMAGYYEFVGEKGRKQKFYITDKDTDGLVVAGIWEAWPSTASADSQLSCTMLTRAADEEMSHVHHRMLVYLTPETASAWMAGEMTREEAEALEKPNVIFYPADQ